MDFKDEDIEKINSYIKESEFKNLCIDLNICSKNDKPEEILEKIKGYIENDMMGKYRGETTTSNFLESIEVYLQNKDFKRDENGYIESKMVLPISKSTARGGLRTMQDVLGNDRKKYIVKRAEGYNGPISSLNNSKQAKYNPTIAYSFFEYLGMKSAKNLIAYDKFPNYYIFSENFLKENEKIYGLDNNEFINAKFITDENNNITHQQIIEEIENAIKNKDLTQQKKITLIKKLKLQYAVQETLKSLICSSDQNLGNTSVIVKEGNDGQIEDINISPAYDLDLSFGLGEEMLERMPQSQILYRTTKKGKSDLESIINEFKEIEGYSEELEKIKNKLNDNYVDKIFDIAYKESRVEAFKSKELKEKYGNFIMRRVATFKEVCKKTNEREDKLKN